MVRRALVTVAASLLAATALASAGHAASRELWPGVTYEPGVQFTSRGPVAINVLRGPRPGGLTTLEPVLSNDTVVGRETLTAMQRRLASTATAAGVNGDYFTLATGKPSGVLMRDAQLVSPPNAGRASAGITTDGRLDIRRVGFAGTLAWVRLPNRPLNALNALPSAAGVALLTDAYGPSAPALEGSAAVVLFAFPAATPDVDLVAPVVEAHNDGSAIAIPPGGAVLLARGAAAATLAAEAPVGATVTIRLRAPSRMAERRRCDRRRPPDRAERGRVFRSGEAFTTGQLGPRARGARSASSATGASSSSRSTAASRGTASG